MKDELADLCERYERYERWADIADDTDAIIACGENWKNVAAAIGCSLQGFNDGRTASFVTPDGSTIEVGPKFRATIETLQARCKVMEELESALEAIKELADADETFLCWKTANDALATLNATQTSEEG